MVVLRKFLNWVRSWSSPDIGITTKIALTALLIAFYVVNARFLRVMGGVPGADAIANLNFSILAVVVAAFVLGPWWAAAVGGLGDVMGAVLWPFGAFFPGYAINFALVGVILGFCVFRKKTTTDLRLVVGLVVGMFFAWLLVLVPLHTLWMHITRGLPFWLVLGARAWMVGVMSIIVVVVAFAVLKFIRKPVDKFLIIDDEVEVDDD